ncbi:hypothetical protein O3P69_015790 [Scylla paramamosain]|uniref:Uncharacterized protein n=1 Tax=Scylla paramamosain TaxID=85552 RepID=A0AAW0T7K7_SCYPA
MRLWVIAAVLLGAVSYGGSFILPLDGAINLPVVIGPGPLIVAILWILKGIAIGAFFILTRKVVPVLNGEGKKKRPLPMEVEEPAHAEPALHDDAAPDQAPPPHGPPEAAPPIQAPPDHAPLDHAPPAHEPAVEGPAEEVSSYSHLRKRSLQDLQTEGILGDLSDESLEEAEDMLWNTALNWDPTGCSLKLLCHLQELPQGNATMEESVLAYLFSHAPQQTQYCLQNFSMCPFSGGELRHLLQQI